MATQVNVVDIPLQSGLDLKTGKKSQPIGRMLQLQNVLMTRPGELSKRPGWVQLTDQVIGGDRVTAGQALAVLGEELVLFDGSQAFSYYPDANNPGWLPKGNFTSVVELDNEVVRNNFSQDSPDVAVLGDLALYTYADSRGGFRCTARSVSTGLVLVYDVELDANALCARALSIGGALYAVFTQGSDLKYQQLLPGQPNVLQPAVVLIGGSVGTGFFDWQISADGGTLWIAYDSTGGINVASVSGATMAVTQNSLLTAGSAQALGSDTAGNLWLAAAVTTGLPEVIQVAQSDLAVLNVVSYLSVPPNYSQGNVVLYESDPVNHVMTVFYGSDPAVVDQQTWWAQFSASRTIASLISWFLGVTPLSKPWVVGGQGYIGVQHQSALQSSAFVVTADSTQRVVAKDRYQSLGPVGTIASSVPLDDQGNYHVSVASGLTPPGVGEFTLDFSGQQSFFTTTVDDSSFVVAGGGLQSYDGVSFVEQNFYLYPDTVAVSDTSGGGQLSAGTYQYVACYAYQDNNGQTTRSTTSVPVEVTVSAGDSVLVAVSALAITDRDPSTIVVEVYRSQVNSTGVLNRVLQLQNSAGAFTVYGNDALSDIDASENTQLYTEGGSIIDFAPAPPCSLVCTFSDRVWVAGIPGQPNALAFSNLSVPGQAVEFNATNTLQVDSFGGPAITALGVINDQLVVFKERAIYLAYGSGPDAGGGGSAYPTPQNVASDAGCTDPNSVVLAGNMSALGIEFQSTKGIYGLSPQQAPSYVGAPVEGFNGFPIAGADLIGDQNVIRFALLEGSQGALPGQGTMIVQDYFNGQWYTFSGLDAVDTVVYNGLHTLLKSDGHVWQEERGLTSDPYGFYSMALETNEIMPVGALGLFRPQKIYFQGVYRGPHKIQVSVAYDGTPWAGEVGSISATSVFSTSLGTYGHGSGTYGYSTTGSIPGAATFGGLSTPYTFMFRPNQPCVSMRIKFEELEDPNSPDDRGGLTLSNIRLEYVDLKRGPYLADKQKF